jgi:hypothetical protein
MMTVSAFSRVVSIGFVLMAFAGNCRAKEIEQPLPAAPQSLSVSPNGIDASKPAPPLAPPGPTASCRLPDSFLTFSNGLATCYGDVDSFIRYALLRSGYREYAYYAIPGGFALVTRLERIDAQGQSMPPKLRWLPNQTPVNPFAAFSDYLSALAKATPGYYRVIVFIVSPEEIIPEQALRTSTGMEKPFEDGVKSLPTDLQNRLFTSADHCTALIYKFKKSNEKTVSLISGAPENGKRQLQKAGIWRYLAH